jgi:hypothetical protein
MQHGCVDHELELQKALSAACAPHGYLALPDWSAPLLVVSHSPAVIAE